MPHSVKLDVFEGPIDLLLHLITRQRVDIYEVSLATIAREYVEAVEAMEDLDLESATGFLVVASTLLELKSARLLPGAPPDSDDPRLLEERDLLLARLVECSTFRAAGEWILAGLEGGADYHARTAGLEPRYVGLVPDILADLAPPQLARAAAVALAPRPLALVDTSHVAPATASVRDAIRSIASRLEADGPLGFRELCYSARTRAEMVVAFLALLELYKAGAVELAQAERFGDIQAGWTGHVGAELVADLAEEYAVDGATS